MAYARTLPNGLLVTGTKPAHAPQLEALQRVCFPSLADAERFKAPHYLRHLDLFPDGQFVVLDEDRVVGATTTLRLRFDFGQIAHRFADIVDHGWLTPHDPDGDWLYGADLAVRPDYRGRGLGTALYTARHELVRRLALKGQVTAGLMSGYGAVKDRMSAQDYYRSVVDGHIVDRTLTMQLHAGFEPRGLVADYVTDPGCDNYAVLIVLPADKRVAESARDAAGCRPRGR
jgi:GNAT superfamily N-acetyltransferase